jgi:hypothetical protein
MLRPMTDMPHGTIGFEAVGEVDDDREEAVDTVLRREIADGRRSDRCTTRSISRPRRRGSRKGSAREPGVASPAVSAWA